MQTPRPGTRSWSWSGAHGGTGSRVCLTPVAPGRRRPYLGEVFCLFSGKASNLNGDITNYHNLSVLKQHGQEEAGVKGQGPALQRQESQVLRAHLNSPSCGNYFLQLGSLAKNSRATAHSYRPQRRPLQRRAPASHTHCTQGGRPCAACLRWFWHLSPTLLGVGYLNQ